MKFSLNQILFPNSSLDYFLNFSNDLKVHAIEIRNDIKSNLIKENDPSKLKNKCGEKSLKILSINALQKFNIWNKDRSDELIKLCKFADQADIWGIVLVPLNDGSVNSPTEQIQLLEESLSEIIKILGDYKVIGLVEPLGFKQSSLRYKSMTVKIINNLQSNKLNIVHDTFHHALANEKDFFPSLTGLVHFSGVSNIYKNIDLNDDHRSVVDENDILANLYQIQKLINSNYQGYFSFEPFSNTLIEDKNIFEITKKNYNFITSSI